MPASRASTHDFIRVPLAGKTQPDQGSLKPVGVYDNGFCPDRCVPKVLGIGFNRTGIEQPRAEQPRNSTAARHRNTVLIAIDHRRNTKIESKQYKQHFLVSMLDNADIAILGGSPGAGIAPGKKPQNRAIGSPALFAAQISGVKILSMGRWILVYRQPLVNNIKRISSATFFNMASPWPGLTQLMIGTCEPKIFLHEKTEPQTLVRLC